MKKIFLIIIVVLTIFGCGKVAVQKDAKSQAGSVKSYVVEKGEITVKLEETGEIQPIKEIEIKSKISGKITKFFVEEGDFVNKGDIIAEIEPDYNQAEMITRVKSTLELSELRLRNAEKDLQDKQKLFDQNFISSQELDSYKDVVAEARINYKSAIQQYDIIKEIETEDNVSKIISTASGTVIQKSVEEGEMVVSNTGSYTAGTVIVVLADLERMVVNSRINEVDISKVSKNQKVEIQVDAYPYEKYQGEITKIAAMAISYNNVKVFPVEIEILNVDERLRPGMTANITIIGEQRKDILVVPIRTIFSSDDNQDIVYKVQNDTIANSVVVKTGINNFQQVEIIEGLAEGDSISYSEPVKDEKDFEFNF
ncbi:MAG: efflux RND transporter periplasmic adaptor subunit [Candidatus Cloacimonetes bacterium]|nr:efflux RND transporter periplasmic adaptor subunit [Candidatus Cloacimonadota bacterium]MCF7813946.1 efflux RND transporter periplasmic adaptor subunit [Candidatus Cloacimonadota bacterium]MCF7868040.1 efflux RND transporter periplasmic adaptor subunit [Candidatus Cloacimonadota bacterium]MCF7883960.1 efflux RND transporter periplasmic adaptor subunit [Candidatus Cloacimonadota bacterium]